MHQPAMADADGGLQGLRHHLQGLLARDEGGEEGDPGAGLRHDGDGVARHQCGVRVGEDVQGAEELDQADRDQHHDVEDQQRVVLEVRVALGPVLGLHQPGEEAERDERGGAQQKGRPDPVGLLGEERAVLHGVRLGGVGLGQRPGEVEAVVLVVVPRQLFPLPSPLAPGPQLRGYPKLCGPGRVVVLPGAWRRRRHGSSPCTQAGLRGRSVVSSVACPPGTRPTVQ